MARRVAARPATPRRGNDSRRSGLPGWVWASAGIAVGALAMTVFFLGHRQTPAPTRPAAPAAARPTAVKPVPVPPKQPPRFTFYHTLPSSEVVIPPAEAKRAERAAAEHRAPPAELAAPGSYVVQVGAYRSREEAERARANVALLGVESHTEQVTLSADDIWYRVRIGPEPSLAAAQAVLDRLQANGIKAILIKQKG